MSTTSLKVRSRLGKIGFFTACAALVVWIPSVGAQTAAQTELNSLLKPRTILTAGPAALAAAVATAIISDTGASIAPGDFAAAALDAYPVTSGTRTVDEVRADRDTSAATVAAAAIKALVSSTDADFNADAAAVTDSLVDVNSGVSREVLSTAGQIAVVKAALGTISDEAFSNNSLLSADQAIGAALSADPYLENLPNGALTTILQAAIAGINGAAGKAQTVAPAAAEAFVAGLISSTIPDGASLPAFAVAILKNVSANAGVDELVAYQVGFRDTVPADLVTLAGALYAKYPAAAVKITQGIVAAVPQGYQNETQRIDLVQALATAQIRHAVSVVTGAVFVDPFYAGQFTEVTFDSILASSGGATLAAADAPGIATSVGATLGQAGNVLTQVADVFSELTGSNDLPVASTATYAAALIGGAVRSAVPAFTGVAAGDGGGRLNVGAGITAATVTDLASILDLLADGIIDADHASLSGAGLRKAASEIGALAATVTRFTGNELFVGSNNVSQPVAAFLAGTLADFIVQLSLGNTGSTSPQAEILAAIRTSITGITNAKVDPLVTAAITDYSSYPAVGSINFQETTVTNL